jgi:phage terminase large subunit-like protein
MLVTQLMKAGLACVEVRPTVLNFSQPMKQLDGLIRSGRIEHDGDPVLTWMIGNVVALENAKANVYLRRDARENKIDGVVALLSALARAMAGPAPPPTSLHELLAAQAGGAGGGDDDDDDDDDPPPGAAWPSARRAGW